MLKVQEVEEEPVNPGDLMFATEVEIISKKPQRAATVMEQPVQDMLDQNF